MKKYLSIFMTLMLMFGMISVLGACSKEDAVAEEVPEDEEVVEEVEENDVVEAESNDRDAEFLDFYGCTYKEAMWGLSADPSVHDKARFYLVRSDEYYTLDNDFYPSMGPVGGQDYTTTDGENHRILYTDEVNLKDSRVGFVSYGLIPVPVLEDNDSIIATYARDVPKLRLYKVDNYGSAICVRVVGKANELRIGLNNLGSADDIEVVGSDGHVYEDWYNLKFGEIYRISWYQSGKAFHEAEVLCDSKSYAFKPSIKAEEIADPFIHLEDFYDYELEAVSVDNNRIAEYDLSDIPSGTYRISSDISVWGGIIEIK